VDTHQPASTAQLSRRGESSEGSVRNVRMLEFTAASVAASSCLLSLPSNNCAFGESREGRRNK
jgi:hypothetical protein